MNAFPPFYELVPHTGAMVLLDAMTHWAVGEATCELRIREHAPFVQEGRVESCVTVEYMAQAVAASLGYEALMGGAGVRVGMIIACKRFTAHASHLCVGDQVTVQVKRTRGNDSLSHFACELRRDGELFADAVLTLYHAERPPD